MLTTIEVKLGLPQNVKINQSMGSVMHGALMEIVASEDADRLHEVGLRPFSQYLYYDRSRAAFFWRISALNKAAFDSVLAPVLQYDKDLVLKQKGYSITLIEKKIVSQSSYEKIADEVFLSDYKYSGCEMKFRTSTGFKSAEQYVIFPQTSLIFQSLINRWNLFSTMVKLEDEKAFQHLGENTFISSYDMQMRMFYIGNGKIPSFTGKLELHLTGNETMRRLVALLMEFSNYSGVGIKTALGMGGITTRLFVGNGVKNND